MEDPAAANSAAMPPKLWNTHIACMHAMCNAAGLKFSAADVAGRTGLAFSTAVRTGRGIEAVHTGWDWLRSFPLWFDALGLRAETSWASRSMQGYPAWLATQQSRIQDSLQRGVPAMYWDYSGFALVLGIAQDGFLVSGVPDYWVPAELAGLPEFEAFNARAINAEGEQPKQASYDAIASPGPDSFVLTASKQDEANDRNSFEAAWKSILSGLNGMHEFVRVRDANNNPVHFHFGTDAYEHWLKMFDDPQHNAKGMAVQLHSTIELRKFAVQFLRSPGTGIADDPRILKAMDFYSQSLKLWQVLESAYPWPPDPDRPRHHGRRGELKDALYEIMRTEQTAGRLIAAAAQQSTA